MYGNNFGGGKSIDLTCTPVKVLIEKEVAFVFLYDGHILKITGLSGSHSYFMLRLPNCNIIDACTVSDNAIAVATSAGIFVIREYQKDAKILQITNYKKFVSCIRPLADNKFVAVLVDYKENGAASELQYR